MARVVGTEVDPVVPGRYDQVVVMPGRGGLLVARNVVQPCYPATALQLAENRVIPQAKVWWDYELTEIQRAGWRAAAPPGVTGLRLFTDTKSAFEMAGLPFPTERPSAAPIPAVAVDSVTWDASSKTLLVRAAAPPASGYLKFFAAPARGPGAAPVRRRERQLGTVSVASVVTDVSESFRSRFPRTLNSGTAVGVEIQYLSSELGGFREGTWSTWPDGSVVKNVSAWFEPAASPPLVPVSLKILADDPAYPPGYAFGWTRDSVVNLLIGAPAGMPENGTVFSFPAGGVAPGPAQVTVHVFDGSSPVGSATAHLSVI